MFTDALLKNASDILDNCKRQGLMLATAESCTGGLISALFTEISGSSTVFERGYVAYSYRSKTELLGVDADVVAQSGAVSSQVAAAMAQGALKRAHVDIACGVTGIAGPGGGLPEKPVGLVYIAAATKKNIVVEKNIFTGDRAQVRIQTVAKALALLKSRLEQDFVYVA